MSKYVKICKTTSMLNYWFRNLFCPSLNTCGMKLCVLMSLGAEERHTVRFFIFISKFIIMILIAYFVLVRIFPDSIKVSCRSSSLLFSRVAR